MLRAAASRVPSLSLRLREGAHYFQARARPTYYRGVGKRYYTGQSEREEGDKRSYFGKTANFFFFLSGAGDDKPKFGSPEQSFTTHIYVLL